MIMRIVLSEEKAKQHDISMEKCDERAESDRNQYTLIPFLLFENSFETLKNIVNRFLKFYNLSL